MCDEQDNIDHLLTHSHVREEKGGSPTKKANGMRLVTMMVDSLSMTSFTTDLFGA